MADRQSLVTPLGMVMDVSGSDKTKARAARAERLCLDCADADQSRSEANLVRLVAGRPWIFHLVR